jgi:hypothetical protein
MPLILIPVLTIFNVFRCTLYKRKYHRHLKLNRQLVVAVVKGVVANPTRLLAVSYTE